MTKLLSPGPLAGLDSLSAASHPRLAAGLILDPAEQEPPEVGEGTRGTPDRD